MCRALYCRNRNGSRKKPYLYKVMSGVWEAAAYDLRLTPSLVMLLYYPSRLPVPGEDVCRQSVRRSCRYLCNTKMADGAGYGCRGQSKHESRKVSVSRQQLSRDKVFPIFCLRCFFGTFPFPTGVPSLT